MGDRAAFEAVVVLPAALPTVLFACDGGLLLADVPGLEGCERELSPPLSGLEAFNGDEGWKYEGFRAFPGDARRGDCGYVLELEDFGERIL